MSLQVNLSFKQIYAGLCEDCKKIIKDIVRAQIQDEAIKKLFEEDDAK